MTRNSTTLCWVVFALFGFLAAPLSAQESIESRLEKLNIQLVPVSKPGAIFKRVVVVGNMAYTSGHICIDADGNIMKGKLGNGVTVEQGQAAARRCAVAMLSSLHAELGSLDRVKRLVKTTGMVNSAPEFEGHSQVVNGFSKVFADLFGEKNGIGARSAVGMSSLPLGAIVEVEAIFELENE